MILETIRKLYAELTPSQRQVADYVLASYRQAVFLTASELAERLSMNEATVIRFAQRLGYSGYPDMIADLQEIVQRELVPGGASGALAKTLLLSMLDLEIDNAERFVHHVSPQTASQVVELLNGAERLYVLGQGLSRPLADLFSLSLQALGFSAHSPAADLWGLAMVSGYFGDDCGVVAISAGQGSSELARALHLAARQGAWTLAISGSPISPCAQAAQLALSCPTCGEMPMASFGSLALLIDAILQCLAKERLEEIGVRKGKAEEARDYIANRDGDWSSSMR